MNSNSTMFIDHFVESRSQKMEKSKLWLLLVAIILHSCFVGIIFIASVWPINYIVDKPVNVVLFQELPPPPPPAPPLRGSSDKIIEVKPQVNSEIAPIEIPDYKPVIEPNIDTNISDEVTEGVDWSEGGMEGGVEGGVAGGVPGGIPDGVPIPKSPDSDIVRIGVDAKGELPVLFYQVEPEYPEEARRAHIEGVVILDAVINIDGTVGKVVILKSVDPSLDRAAIKAVKQWRFQPARVNGKAVRAYFTLTVTFKLM